jgi:hypothetical protein
MRIACLLITLLCASNSFGQEISFAKNQQGQVEVTEVIRKDSFPAAQLFLNAKLFLANAFHGVRETSQIKDEKTKSVATKGSFPVVIENGNGDEIKAKVVFTLIIQSRDNMYKYVINDFYFAFTEESGITSYASFDDHRGIGMTKKQWQDVETQTTAFLQPFIEDLKIQMSQSEVLCKEMLAMQRKKRQ